MGVFSNPGFSYTSAGIDSLRLNANLNLETLDASSVGFNLRGNYKNVGYIGPSIGVSFKQLNVFRGAENLSVEVDAYYDFPFGAFKERKSNSSGFSFRSQLSAPLLKAPFNFVKSTYALPKQSVALNLDYNNRIDYFTIVSWNTSYGFTWKSKPNITHQLNLINATYSDILNSTSRFDSLVVDNPSLRTSLVDQFILGSSYTINIDNRYNENTRIGTYFQGSVELSGNLLNLLNGVITNIEEGNRKFLGVKYAQFARFNYDFRTYWRTGLNSKLVFRHLGGIGISYGNSDQMPYIKQFIIGGSNSLRPIVSRAAGPGRYIELNQAEVNQVGDLKLEWNLEYRFRLFWKLEGAIWSDAGNIWLLKEDPNRPRSGVRWGHIFEDSYLTSGLGLRLDLDFMILRVDYGAVLYVPLLGKGLNWIWQNKLPLWHPVIGFGYPF